MVSDLCLESEGINSFAEENHKTFGRQLNDSALAQSCLLPTKELPCHQQHEGVELCSIKSEVSDQLPDVRLNLTMVSELLGCEICDMSPCLFVFNMQVCPDLLWTLSVDEGKH